MLEEVIDFIFLRIQSYTCEKALVTDIMCWLLYPGGFLPVCVLVWFLTSVCTDVVTHQRV